MPVSSKMFLRSSKKNEAKVTLDPSLWSDYRIVRIVYATL
jgi:hypothetical protein